jgi:hypothetical protein
VYACADVSGTEKVYAGVRKTVVKIVSVGQGKNCTITGSGFVVSANGHVLSARHVVPDGCDNLTVNAIFEGQQGTVRMEVVQRSAHDVILLRPVTPINILAYLKREDHTVQDDAFLDKRVLVVSFYEDLTRVTYTVAKVEAVELAGGVKGKWAICGPAANRGRSGSPVVTEAGNAVAVFVERPAMDQDRARIVPLKYVDDLDFSALQPAAAPAAQPATTHPSEILYGFALDFLSKDFADPRQSQGRYLFDAKGFQDASGMSLFQIAGRVAGGAVLRYERQVRPTFNAAPGYIFDPSDLRFNIASHNPPSGPLPSEACDTSSSVDCYEISTDRRRITLRLRLFTGSQVDQAAAWLHGELIVRQIRASPR